MKGLVSKFSPYVFSVLVSVFFFQFSFDNLKFYLSDLNFRGRGSPSPSNQVVTIHITHSTIQYLGREPNLMDWNGVIETLQKAGAKAIWVTKPFSRWEDEEIHSLQPYIDWDSSSVDKLLTLSAKENLFFHTDRLFLSGVKDLPSLAPPFDFLKVLSGPRTSDSTLLAQDGVSRRILLTYQDQILGHLHLASLYKSNKQVNGNKQEKMEFIRGAFTLYDSEQVWVDFLPRGSLPNFDFEGVIQSKVPLDQLKGKIILIGEDLGKAAKDYVKTPFSRDPSAMTLNEFHAQGLDSILRNSSVVMAPSYLGFILSLLIGILTVYFSFHVNPLKSLMFLFLFIPLLLVFQFLIFQFFTVHFSVVHSLLTCLVVYYLLLPYRLFIEQKNNWEFKQKNKLLSQVEELKTNFISMMSHDLKTPIARIQGMTDVILNDDIVLSSKQREAIDFIRSSSNDLLRVLSAILNYARIENQGVELNKTNRDINELLDDVINRHLFLAKLKHIQILFEKEPLFLIPVDADLIRQVFANLIENAIKYSEENSKILVTTEEFDGWVRVQVADQGPGIPLEDRPYLFTKFFRGSRAKSSPVKGSGLGLFLTHYFVELHKGRITVESEVNVGTTFTVELPIKS